MSFSMPGTEVIRQAVLGGLTAEVSRSANQNQSTQQNSSSSAGATSINSDTQTAVIYQEAEADAASQVPVTSPWLWATGLSGLGLFGALNPLGTGSSTPAEPWSSEPLPAWRGFSSAAAFLPAFSAAASSPGTSSTAATAPFSAQSLLPTPGASAFPASTAYLALPSLASTTSLPAASAFLPVLTSQPIVHFPLQALNAVPALPSSSGGSASNQAHQDASFQESTAAISSFSLVI